jgi:large subunit ribosomal protein L15
MKLHDLRPADGSRTERTRVGRGIAAGKGKTAGRGTKGQKARAGGSIPPWFEGGQTPLHVRIPKLRGFKNRFKLVYEIVNIGDIAAAAERGAFEAERSAGAKGKAGSKSAAAQITINQDILRDVGLVRTLDKPLKILGGGELGSALFVVADAFTASARSKIEAAGGTVNVLEVPTKAMPALGVDRQETTAPEAPSASSATGDVEPSEPAGKRRKGATARATASAAPDVEERADETSDKGPLDDADTAPAGDADTVAADDAGTTSDDPAPAADDAGTTSGGDA